MSHPEILHDCPDENALAAYLEALLPEVEAHEVEAHLDVCAHCHRLTASLLREDTTSAPGLVRAEPASPGPGEPRDPHTEAVARLKKQVGRSLRPGELIGRYVLGELLGEGGMGVVYAARDPELERDVAVKLVTPASEDSMTQRKRLLREARAAAKLQHPNVVAVYDVGEVGSAAYLAMELVKGRPLRAYVGDASVPIHRRIDWILDVARALSAAHKEGLVHRDVKPENVMVRDDGVVKVLDFGIARQEASEPTDRSPSAVSPVAPTSREDVWRLTRAGTVIGTPAYMAPEQLRNERLDARTDQFAWGVLAHELLAGELPWKGRELALVGAILTDEPPPLRGVEAHVAAAVSRALSKAPDDRFSSMDEAMGAMTTPRPAEVRRGGRGLFVAAGVAASAVLVAAALVVPFVRGLVRANETPAVGLVAPPVVLTAPDSTSLATPETPLPEAKSHLFSAPPAGRARRPPATAAPSQGSLPPPRAAGSANPVDPMDLRK